MNTSNSPLSLDHEVQSRIRKIRAFSRSARMVCGVLLVLGLAGLVASLFINPFSDVPVPEGAQGSAGEMLSSALSPVQLKLWWVISYGAVMGVAVMAVFQLYRLFGNLAVGAIYTAGNVRLVRRFGLLWLLSAILHVVLPLVAMAVANQFGDVSFFQVRVLPAIGRAFNSFAAAGLVLLASWIMDVGLYEKEHADALQRDADLVI